MLQMQRGATSLPVFQSSWNHDAIMIMVQAQHLATTLGKPGFLFLVWVWSLAIRRSELSAAITRPNLSVFVWDGSGRKELEWWNKLSPFSCCPAICECSVRQNLDREESCLIVSPTKIVSKRYLKIQQPTLS